MSRASLRDRIAWLLDYEPTWFPEMASGLAIFVWSLAALLTRDYHVQSFALIMPSLGIGFGPVRWALLFRVRYAPRVAAAFAASIWWTWIVCAVDARFGVAPTMGPIIGVLMLDVLTLARFSIPCFRDLLADLRGWRARR